MKEYVVMVMVLGLCIGAMRSCGREEAPPEPPEVAIEEPAVEVEKPAVTPGPPLEEAKVLGTEELLRFVPKAPEGWKGTKPTASTQRVGPFGVTKATVMFSKGGERVSFTIEDLGTNNPYFSMKEPVFKIKEEKTAEGYKKKLMIGNVAAQEVFDGKKKLGMVFAVFEKRIQLNVSGTGMEDNGVVVELAKTVNFEELRKALGEKSR